MTILYSCRHDGDQYRISKFNEHGEVLSSYLCTESECDCPAGQRRMCRHREMLPLFIRREAINSHWWLDYDRGGWVQMFDETPAIEHTTPAEEQLFLQSLTQTSVSTFFYGSDEPPLDINHVELSVPIASEASTTPADTYVSEVNAAANVILDDNLFAEVTIPSRAKSWRRF